MTSNLNEIIQEIFSLEKRIESDIDNLRQQNKIEEVRFVSELEKNFLEEIKKYENELIHKNKEKISEFEKEVIGDYSAKLSQFEEKIKNIQQNTIEKVINKIKEKLLSYGNR